MQVLNDAANKINTNTHRVALKADASRNVDRVTQSMTVQPATLVSLTPVPQLETS